MTPNVKDVMTEPKKHRLSFRRFASKTFSRRRTTTGIIEKPSPQPPSPPPPPPAPASKSRIPTPARSSRSHVFFSRSNSLAPRPDSSSKMESQIPRPTSNRPSDVGILNVVEKGPLFNQDGRYPSIYNSHPSRSVVEVNQRPSSWGPINGLIHRTTIPKDSPSIPRFMRPTSSSAARAPSGNRRSVPKFSGPLPPRTKPDREGDDTPTMRQVSHVDDGTSTVNPTNEADQATENVISHSPSASQYGIISNVPEDFSTQTSGLPTPTPQNPNYGSYSFSPSDQTIGLALTAPIPPGGDSIHTTAAEGSESFNFVMPENFDSSSKAEGQPPLESSTETPEPVIEDRALPQVDEEHASALMVRTHLPLPSSFHASPVIQQMILIFLLISFQHID